MVAGRLTMSSFLLLYVELFAVRGAYQAGKEDGRGAVETGLVADFLENGEDFQILEKSLSDLLAFRIVREVGETENLALARQWEFGIEGGPVDLVAELQSGEHDAVGVQQFEQRLELGLGERGIGVGQGRAAPHGRIDVRLIRSLGRARRVLRTEAKFNLDALRGGAFGEVDPLGVSRDATADDVYACCVELRKYGVLVGDAGAHGIDHIYANDQVFGVRGLRRQRGNRGQCDSDHRETQSMNSGHVFLLLSRNL
jgi:hypothetical protein